MNLHNIQDESRKIRMTPEEKNAMRARIFGVPAASPYVTFNFQFRYTKVAASLLIVLVVLVGSGTGVAYAAEGSLPGQPLYPIKVNVDEPVEVALAQTPEAKADVYAQLAQTRVEEAEALAAQGELDATATQELSQNFDTQVADADALSMQIASSDPATASDIETSLAASLEAGGAVLAQVGQDAGTTTRQESRTLAARVLARAAEIGLAVPAATSTSAASTSVEVALGAPSAPAQSPMRINTLATAVPQIATSTASGASTSASTTLVTESASATSIAESSSTASAPEPALTASTASTTAKFSLESQERAVAAVAQAQSEYDAARASLDASTTAALDAQFAQANAFIQNGEYTQALRLSAKLSTLIEAQQKLNVDILPLLLQISASASAGDDGDNSGR